MTTVRVLQYLSTSIATVYVLLLSLNSSLYTTFLLLVDSFPTGYVIQSNDDDDDSLIVCDPTGS